MFRPQFPMTPAPAGFVWQPCIFEFDRFNLPALNSISLSTGQESGYIPLHLDHDACFVLLAVKVQNGGFNILLFDPWLNQLMDDYVAPDLYSSDGSPVTILEGPGIEVPKGAAFSVRLQGQ